MKVKDIVKTGNYVTTGMMDLTKVEYTDTSVEKRNFLKLLLLFLKIVK